MTQATKQMTVCLLVLAVTLGFAACTPVETPPETQPTAIPTTEPTLPGDAFQTDPTLPIVPSVNANVELEQLRMPGYNASWLAQFTTRFGGFESAQNPSELADIFDELAELGKDFSYPEGYDDAFFADHYLLLLPMQSTSGSVRYEAEISADGDKVNITVVGKMPEVGTADMVDWLILIPISREQYPDPDQIEINVQSSQGRDDGLNIQDK